MTDIKQIIISRMSDGRERTAAELSEWLKRQGVIAGETITSGLLMDLVEDGAMLVERRSGVNCFRQAEEGAHQSLRLTVEEVAKEHGFSVVAVRGPKRHRALSKCRQEAMYRASLLGFSTAEIGRAVNRDRNTVAFGIDAYMNSHREAAE